MTLRTAIACSLLAFALGWFLGHQQGSGRVATAVDAPPTANVPVPQPAAIAPNAPAASGVAAAVAPPVVVPSAGVAPEPTHTIGDQLRSRPSGPDPTQMGQAEFSAALVEFFEQEKEDAAWKASTEAFVTDHFYRENPLGPGATLTSVECRATICRIFATSPERRPQEVFGPRSSRWGDLIALHITGNTPPDDAPMQITGYLRPMTTFPRPH